MNKNIQQVDDFLLLKSTFFARFKPGESIKKVTLPFYKIVAINVGTDTTKPILLKRLTDEVQTCISYDDLYSKFAEIRYLDRFYQPLGFSCKAHDKFAILLKNITCN